MDPLNKKASFYHLKRCFYFKLNHLNKNSMEVKKSPNANLEKANR